jgi:hypothetical protein
MASQTLIIDAKPAIRAFVEKHFPEEVRYFEPFWAAVLPFLASGDMLSVRTTMSAGGGLQLASGHLQHIENSLTVIDVIARVISDLCKSGFRDETVPVKVHQYAQNRLKSQSLLKATIDLVREIVKRPSSTSDEPRYHVLKRNPRAGQRVEKLKDLDKDVAYREMGDKDLWDIFMDDEKGMVFALGKKCGMRSNDRSYRILRELLDQYPRLLGHVDLIRCVAREDRELLGEKAAAKAVSKWVDACRHSLEKGSKKKAARRWIQVSGGATTIHEEVSFCLLARD